MTSRELKRLFGLRVQALRRRRGLTQEELAEAIGKSVDTVSNIERGFSSTRIETALMIADAVGVSLAELFELQERAYEKDRERRNAIERVVDMLDEQDEKSIQAVGDMITIILKTAWNIHPTGR